MANMAVRYWRGNYALQTLCGEISARWGKPSRPYEYVTGYLAADNFTGHNADQNGVVHGVDIFVGSGNLSAANANILTAFLRAEGLKGTIPGHPDRLYYIIYRDRIAGDFSSWEWVGAGYGHWDHVHISTCDLFWGDPAPISPLDYDSTSPWGISKINGQGAGSKPIQEDDMSDADVKKINEHTSAMMWHGFTSGGKKHPGIGKVTFNNQQDIRATRGKVEALEELVKQLAKGQGITIDYAKVEAAAAAGVAKAITDGVDLDATVTIKGGGGE